MTPEREPWADYDPFLDDLKRYFQDVAELTADGEDIDNNSSRLVLAFYDMLEKLELTDMHVIEKINSLLPKGGVEEFTLDALVLEYKLAPIRLMNQRQPDCPLPLEKLTPKRIETIFNLALAGEEIRHDDCSSGYDANSIACDHSLTCPKRLCRHIGIELFELLTIQRAFQEDYVKPQRDPTCANLLQLEQTLLAHQLMLPTEITVHRNQTYRYFEDQMQYMSPPEVPRTNDEASED